MNARLRIVSVLLAIAATGDRPASAQTKPCKTCKAAAVLPCEEHEREDLSSEEEVLYCSVVDGCATCSGTGRVACPDCEDGKRAALELAARAERIPKLRDGLADLDRTMGRRLRKAESEHFVLVWEMTGMKVEKKRLSEHQMLHLTIQRLEAVYADYVQLFGLDDLAFAKKFRIFVWHLPADDQRGSIAFCGLHAMGGSKLMGGNPNYSVCGAPPYFRGDEQLHRNLVHCTTHLLFSHEQPSMWVGNMKGGWIEEGLAHFFEDRFFGRCENYCFEEQNTNFDFKSGRFKMTMRKMIEQEDVPPLAAAIQKNTTDLDTNEHPLVMAMVDFLIHIDPKKFDLLGRKLRALEEVRPALQEVYGMSILEFADRLEVWAKETYPVAD